MIKKERPGERERKAESRREREWVAGGDREKGMGRQERERGKQQLAPVTGQLQQAAIHTHAESEKERGKKGERDARTCGQETFNTVPYLHTHI